MVKLDIKDRKLLYELDLNSRQSVQQLAKKVHLSKDAIKYRIKRLKDEGIIKSFSAVVDTGKLGFTSFRLLLKFYNLSPAKEKGIVDFFLKNKNLVWLVQSEGNWDMNTWFLYKSVEEMNEFWEELLRKYGNYISKRELGIYTNVTYYSRAYLSVNKPSSFSVPVVTLPKETKLSKDDLKIINLLSKDARMPIIEIADAIKLTPKTIIKRIKSLEENKIIVGYRTEFDLGKLGYKYYKVHINTFNLTKEKSKELENYIQDNPYIIYHDRVLGGYDIELEVQIEDENKMREFIDKLNEKFSRIIKDHDILRYYKEYRLRFFPDE